LRELRQAIASHVRAARGTECDSDQVFVVSGAQRAMDLLCQLLLDPGDEAWMEEPGYPGARSALVAAGARIHPVKVDEEGPCLHGLDVDGRVIYVGSFSKTLFPALRLGFMIVPRDIHDELLAVRRASEVHPPRLDQAVLADFMLGGHYERHLRRVRAAYRERLEALEQAARRHCGGALRLRPARTGLHAVADLVDADAGRAFEAAAERNVEVMPLSAYYFGRAQPQNALVLGFGGVRADSVEDGMKRLAAAIDDARRQP